MFACCTSLPLAVWPTIRTRLFSSFATRADLINAVMASCHLPTLSDGSLTMRFRGRLHIDGGLLSVLTPPPHAAHTVLVCRSVLAGQVVGCTHCHTCIVSANARAMH